MRNDIKGAPIFSEHLPVRLVARRSGRVVLETEFTAPHLNATGTAHGGILATIMDMAVTGSAAAGVNDGEGTYGVTMSLTINFLRSVGPGYARCEGQIIGGGARTKFVEARLFDAKGELVTSATATVRVIERPR